MLMVEQRINSKEKYVFNLGGGGGGVGRGIVKLLESSQINTLSPKSLYKGTLSTLPR